MLKGEDSLQQLFHHFLDFKKNLYIKLVQVQLMYLLSYNSISSAISIPTQTNLKYLNDYVGVINEPQKGNILGIGRELELKTGAQATIVIINSTNGTPIENYSLELFRSWGIGQKNKDNGLLVLISIDDKAWRVEVGRGLEGAIPDALSNRVMETLSKPSFLEGNYSEGVMNSYSTFCDIIAKEYNITLDKSLHLTVPSYGNPTERSSRGFAFSGGIILILFLLVIILNRGRISSTLLQIIFWSNIGRGGPRGGPGGGGNFGGFGGGSSNGGGSSGGW